MKQSKKTKQITIWLLFTILAFTLAIVWDRSSRNEVSATSSPAVAEKTNPSVHGTKIQDIQLGERVVGKNPQEIDGLDESILTEIPHVGYNLLFKKPDGTHSSIELLRPKNWLETEKIILREVSETTSSDELLKNAIRQKSSDGKDCNIEVYIDLPEMGTVGWATLISIKENIEIKEGSGNVVTGRFRHIANNVIDLQVEGVEKIGCTDNHPIWSVDREDFIEAGKLVEGERVLLYNGETRRVVQKLPRPGPQYVNNLEVFGEHVYHVTLDGILVHNFCKLGENMLSDGIKPTGILNPQAHHDLPQKYRDKFAAIGIDIDESQYGRWVSGNPIGEHQSWTVAFNKEWEEFFESKKTGFTIDDVLEKMRELRNSGKYQ